MKHIIHDWDDGRQSIRILNIRAAMLDGKFSGECVLRRQRQAAYGKLLDLRNAHLAGLDGTAQRKEYQERSRRGFRLKRASFPTKSV